MTVSINPDQRFHSVSSDLGQQFALALLNTLWSVQGPVVQSILSLTSLLVVKMLTVLVSTISNSDIFADKMWVAFANAKATHIFSAKILVKYAIFNDQRFNDMLNNDFVSFEQLGQGSWVVSAFDFK